jgi:ankyrin repeat protein
MWLLLVALGIVAVAVPSYFALFPKNERLRWAASEGNTTRVRNLVARGAQVNSGDEDGITPLMLAAAAGHEETVRELIRLGADVNIKAHPYPGDTALYYAVLNNHPGVIKILLDSGADPNAKMAENSMLGIAAGNSSVEMLQVLLGSRKVDVHVRDEKGNTLDMLVMRSYTPVERKAAALKLLIEHGCDPRLQNSAGKSSCSIACEEKQPQILEGLPQCSCRKVSG